MVRSTAWIGSGGAEEGAATRPMGIGGWPSGLVPGLVSREEPPLTHVVCGGGMAPQGRACGGGLAPQGRAPDGQAAKDKG